MAERISANGHGAEKNETDQPADAAVPEAGMSVREAGRKGGKTTRARYGAEFFSTIGAKGGKAVSERYTSDHFREIGRKGGRRVAELIAKAKLIDEEQNGNGPPKA